LLKLLSQTITKNSERKKSERKKSERKKFL